MNNGAQNNKKATKRVRFGIWEDWEEYGANEPVSVFGKRARGKRSDGYIGHIAINTALLQRARAWYERVVAVPLAKAV